MISQIRPLGNQLRMQDLWLSLVTMKVRLVFKTEETIWFENWTCAAEVLPQPYCSDDQKYPIWNFLVDFEASFSIQNFLILRWAKLFLI